MRSQKMGVFKNDLLMTYQLRCTAINHSVIFGEKRKIIIALLDSLGV
jgi:hypothetical protein